MGWDGMRRDRPSDRPTYVPLNKNQQHPHPHLTKTQQGKTVELIALILANPRPDTPPPPTTTTPSSAAAVAAAATDAPAQQPIPGRATLIITPSTLLGQYITEIDKCTHMGAVRTAVYVGPLKVNFWTKQLRLPTADGLVGARCRPTDLTVGMRVLAPVCVFDEEDGEGEGAADAPGLSEAERQEKRVRLRAQYFEGVVHKLGPKEETAHVSYTYTPEALAGESIVLATYDTLRSHGKMLKGVAWHRVVVVRERFCGCGCGCVGRCG